MAQTGKKFRSAAEKVDRNKRYTITDGFKLLKETIELRKTKFDQTVDVAINLGVDPKQVHMASRCRKGYWRASQIEWEPSGHRVPGGEPREG